MNKQEAFQNLREAIQERRNTFATGNLFEDFEHFQALLGFLKPSCMRLIERSKVLVRLITEHPELSYSDRELLAVVKAEEISFRGGMIYYEAINEFEFVTGFTREIQSLENQFLILAHQL